MVGGGGRALWEDLPHDVRAEVEQRLGGVVCRVTSAPHGFTPGMASALETGDGQRVFVKAISSATTPQGPTLYRQEAAISAALPASAPVPRFLWWCELADWVVLAFECVDGRSPDLSHAADLRSVLELYSRLATALDPAPLQASSLAEAWADDFGRWSECARPSATYDISRVAHWLPVAAPRLAELEAPWSQVTAGTCLLHGDLRADNMLINDLRGAVAVDWPEACVGAPWVDLVLALPSFALQGVDPESVVRAHPLTRQVPMSAIDAVIAAVAGYFATQCLLPAPRGLPMVREFQRQQGLAALQWISRRDDEVRAISAR